MRNRLNTYKKTGAKSKPLFYSSIPRPALAFLFLRLAVVKIKITAAAMITIRMAMYSTCC